MTDINNRRVIDLTAQRQANEIRARERKQAMRSAIGTGTAVGSAVILGAAVPPLIPVLAAVGLAWCWWDLRR